MGISDTMDRLKKKIHGSKIPLSLRGQRAMGVIYMVVPIVGGTLVMKWAMGREEKNREWMKTSPIGAHSPPSPAMTIDDVNQSLRVQKSAQA